MTLNRKKEEILRQMTVPVFPNRHFDVTEFVADASGKADSTAAIQRAIDEAHQAGGGTAIVPKGVFRSGALRLKSNVELHIEQGAVIKFSQNPDDYLPVVLTRFEGVELYNYSPLIYAYEAENIALTGKGTLDGQGDEEHWWPWKRGTNGQPSQEKDRDALFEMAERNVPVEERRFGKGHYLRPNFIQPYRCQNILIKDVTVLNSPMWQVHPVLCENVTVDGVKVVGHGPNTDGVNPESCKNVVIKHCHFDNGDDCIAVKSGRNADGRRINIPAENIVIENNEMKDGHGGVTIGSEISGGVNNIFAEGNLMDSPNLDRALRIKTNSVRGGILENIYFHKNVVKSLKREVIAIDMEYEEGDAGNFKPVVRDIEVDQLKSTGGQYGIRVLAYDHSLVTGLKVTDSKIDGVEIPMELKNVKDPVFLNLYINGKRYDSPEQ
ncbi:glycoside hydrolase family 28 protein [Bacillus swezeyi]|uniref:Glycoside hydrolase family 28 protein n=2 Tax=Bacillus swezeyi TaxID=1925020 RepID=A0A5M8RU25_9BACI|nr:glycoside hydrolase family 28 protein [Bacillus swezeyi]KAA6450616.1 glycoside hydrolase family 28 protein [Bacillus swezeyi]TYS37152.1 glycoside hydrolase family 28 protein [Bacillus swezeyi]